MNKSLICPICGQNNLVIKSIEEDDYICMNCGWISYNGNQVPGDVDMMGDNEI